jgi:hypothetical protein
MGMTRTITVDIICLRARYVSLLPHIPQIMLTSVLAGSNPAGVALFLLLFFLLSQAGEQGQEDGESDEERRRGGEDEDEESRKVYPRSNSDVVVVLLHYFLHFLDFRWSHASHISVPQITSLRSATWLSARADSGGTVVVPRSIRRACYQQR